MKPTGDKSPHYRLAAKRVAFEEAIRQRTKLGRKNANRTLLSGSGQIGEATRVLASYLYDCSQTVQTLHSPDYLFN